MSQGRPLPPSFVVKLLDPGGLEASNEALAWLFLRAAGISAPPQAALLTLSEEKAVKVLGRERVRREFVNHGHVLAWCSSKLEFQSIRAVFAGEQAAERLVAVFRTIAGSAIAAFDELFLNLDRNTGNVLFTGPESCVAIDHEHTFGRQDWRRAALAHLPTDSDALKRLKMARNSGALQLKEFEEVMNRIAHAAERHGPALEACEKEMRDLLFRLYGDEGSSAADRVLTFISERSTQHWIKDRLGVV